MEWIEEGQISDPFDEFFIQKMEIIKGRSSELKIDWENEFKLRYVYQADDKLLCLEPKIMEGLSKKILEFGKSKRLTSFFKINHKQADSDKEGEADKGYNQVYLEELEKLKEGLPEPNGHMELETINKKRKYKLASFNSSICRSGQPKPAQLPHSSGSFQAQPQSEMFSQFAVGPSQKTGCEVVPFGMLQRQPSSMFQHRLSPDHTRPEKNEPTKTSFFSDKATQNRIASALHDLAKKTEFQKIPGFLVSENLKTVYSEAINKTGEESLLQLGRYLNKVFDLKALFGTLR